MEEENRIIMPKETNYLYQILHEVGYTDTEVDEMFPSLFDESVSKKVLLERVDTLQRVWLKLDEQKKINLSNKVHKIQCQILLDLHPEWRTQK